MPVPINDVDNNLRIIARTSGPRVFTVNRVFRKTDEKHVGYDDDYRSDDLKKNV